MRYGATVAAAKAGSSPEFLVQRREPGDGKQRDGTRDLPRIGYRRHSRCRESRRASMEGEVVTVPIGGAPIKIATVVDPQGNVLELMELPKGVDHLPHP